MSEFDKRHGTSAGYVAGCRQECCRTAIADWTRHYRTRQYLQGPLTIDGTGTRRRIRALMALGWSTTLLDAELGRKRTYTAAVVSAEGPVRRSTADEYAALYDRLCMTMPPTATRYDKQRASRVRNLAGRNGWLSPLAWDDIDDPSERPHVGRDHTYYTAAELVAEWHWLRAAGESIDQAARQLGVTVGAIEKACERQGKKVA